MNYSIFCKSDLISKLELYFSKSRIALIVTELKFMNASVKLDISFGNFALSCY
jgi:hypothetical protein